MRLYQPGWVPNYISINIEQGKSEEVISFAQSKWGQFFQGNPFNYFFLDDRFAEQYEADQRLGQLVAIFTGLAIFVSCLGLFALAAFIAERRTKEIGIRKVLGASVQNLVTLLSKEFLILVGVAILIAIPLSYFVMNKWLDSFVMRIDLEWWVFLLAGIIAMGIGLLTVGFNSLKAATVNPVESIKIE